MKVKKKFIERERRIYKYRIIDIKEYKRTKMY